MLAIEYFEGNAPLINIYSPCGGYITIGQSRNGIVYFKGSWISAPQTSKVWI